MTKIISFSQSGFAEVIKTTVDFLKKGKLVVFPSDTVYGLLVDAKNEEAVSKLIKFKNRPPGKAISVFVSDINMLQDFGTLPINKNEIIKSLLPGPFTVVLDSKDKLDRRLSSEKNTMGFRLTQYDPIQELVSKFGTPITATSANLGGKSPHYSIESLLNQLPNFKKDMIDLIVDAGKLPRNKPSTVIDFTTEKISILRKGDVLLEKKDTYISKSPKKTRSIASFLIKKSLKDAKGQPVVYLIKGDLGAGKTEFTRGVAEVLKIDKIVSPTFVVYYEYEVGDKTLASKLVHADFYNIQDIEEFEHLGLEEYLKNNVVMVCEWGEKLGELYDFFNKKAQVYVIEISHMSKNERKITFGKTQA